MGTPRSADSFGWTMRAAVSAGPPGGNGMMNSMARVGYGGCAAVGGPPAAETSSGAAARETRLMWSSFSRRVIDSVGLLYGCHDPTMPVGASGAGRPVSRRGVGRPAPRRPPPVRDADPRGRAGRALVVDDSQEAGGVPARVRRLRPDEGRALYRGAGRAPPRRRRDREEPGQDRGDRGQRRRLPGRPARARELRRVPLAVRGRPARAEHAEDAP